jgi:hypothetical protein
MNIRELISCYARLGKSFLNASNAELDAAIRRSEGENHWFTAANISFALKTWAGNLHEEKIKAWLEDAVKSTAYTGQGKRIGLIMAGNIPLAGLHDLLAVLASGHKAVVKLSSEDTVLMRFAISELEKTDSYFRENIEIAERLNGVDAIIATGSNNSSRYFEYYFRDIPKIIRKNRNSAAILSGKESPGELEALGWDIFRYYGKGCRNVTHLYFPEGYDIATFYEGISGFGEIMNHNKYANNYTYHKAIFLMNQQAHFDNNFLLTKEDEAIYAPIGCVNFSFYENPEKLKSTLASKKEEIQTIAGNPDVFPGCSPFGKAQEPELSDYADGVDTLAFCRSL